MQALEWPGKFLATNAQAQQDIPAQHRLLNAGGMFAGWWALDQIRHIAFGLKQKSEGEYVEVKREDVPAPLQFLHKIIDWDPHSETSENQWKKLVYQFLPGVGAGVGAVAGSMYAFERNGRAQQFKTAHLKGIDKLGMLDMDFAAQYAQSTPLRVLSGFFGTFSAASGLTFVYGMFLNNAFAAANGAKIFTGALSKGNMGPQKAAEAQIEMLDNYIKAGKSDAWASQFVERVLEPMFGHKLDNPDTQKKAVDMVREAMDGAYSQFQKSGAKTKDVANAITDDLVKKLGLTPKDAKYGNANSVIKYFNDTLASVGLGSSYTFGEAKKSQLRKTLLAGGVGAAALGLGVGIPSLAGAAEKPHAPADSSDPSAPTKHATPNASGKTPSEYVTDAMAMHNAEIDVNHKAPPGWLKWMGDAQLAVLPTNRIDCAIGLTAGLMLAGNMAKIATGYGLDGKALDMSKVPTYLQKLTNVVKDYNPKGLRPRDRWIKYAQWGVYSLGGMIGIKIGTDFAYKNVSTKNSDPHYLEDYLPRVSMHQGETWSWLGAFSGIFGSASGLWSLPIPGLNYAVGLASRATSMQDRNFMIGGLNGMMSGATTTSFLRLREGVNYMCHYAVNNPAETPAQIEFLAYTMLGPIFKDQLTVEHIQQFTRAVHQVRDKYWEQGGIPKEKRAQALRTMREVFTGAGLEVLLIDMGLNPGSIMFDKLNGLSGTIGNLGVSQKIHAEQTHYHDALKGRLDKYVSEQLITRDQANWVNAGIEAMQHGKPTPAPLQMHTDHIEDKIVDSLENEKMQKRFAHRLPKKDNFTDLLEKSENPGDWRRKANLDKESRAPAVVGG